MLEKVISGAQVGADIAGLRAAHKLGIPTGGFVTKGARTLFGPLPQEEIDKYCLVETAAGGYSDRTFKNVESSDMTIRFAYNFYSPGEKCTLRAIMKYDKPFFDVTLFIHEGMVLRRESTDTMIADALRQIRRFDVKVLNIAGNGNQAIEDYVEHFCHELFVRARL